MLLVDNANVYGTFGRATIKYPLQRYIQFVSDKQIFCNGACKTGINIGSNLLGWYLHNNKFCGICQFSPYYSFSKIENCQCKCGEPKFVSFYVLYKFWDDSELY